MNDPDRFVFEAPGSAGPQRIAAVAAAVPPERDAGGGLLEFGQRQLQDFEKSPRPMRIFERETCQYLAVNDAAVALYGYTREEFLTLTVKDTRHPDEHHELLESFDKPEGYLMHFEPRRHVKKSGEVFVAEVVTQDILFEGRRARVSLTIDVTERVRVLDLLRQREQEFEALAEHLPDPIARFDCNGRFVYVNSAVEKLTGASRSAILGRTQRELFMPDTVVELFERSLAETARSGQAHTLEFSYPSASGNDRLFEAHHVPERDATGEIVTVLCVARDITERKKSEDDLRRQKNLFAAIVDNLPVGVFIRDAQTLRYVIRNRYCESTFAHFGESWVGKTVHDLFPKEYADRSVATDRQALESGKMLEIPEWKALEGQIHHVRKVPLYGDNGEPWLVVGIADDITERKRTERDLRKNEEFLRRVIESSRDCIKVLELDGSIAWMSAGGQRLMEIEDVACVLGRSYVDFWSGTDRESALAALATARAGGASRFEGSCPSAKGTPQWWDEIATPILGADGTPERLLVVSRDVTESRKAENALRESEERFRQLAENIREVFWVNSPAGDNMVYVSPAYEEIWGRSCESLYRNPRGWMGPIHPEDLPAVRAAQKRMPGGEHTDVEYRIIRPDGALRWIRDRSYPMKRDDGAPLVCGIAEDITGQKRAEEERLTHAIHQRDALVREVHHRIKNHLQGIAGLLRNKAADDPATTDTIEAAVAQLQSVAVVYGLQSELAESGVPLCRVLEAICSSAEGLSGARVVRAFAADTGSIRLAATEAVPVAVALNELVFNAIEHGVPRGRTPRIEVALTEKKDGADIRIVNRGKLSAGFDYSRGIGTGTGLDLVKTLLGPSGGKLRFGSGEGRVEVNLSLRPPLVPRGNGKHRRPSRIPENER